MGNQVIGHEMLPTDMVNKTGITIRIMPTRGTKNGSITAEAACGRCMICGVIVFNFCIMH